MTHEEIAAKLRQAADYMDAGDLKMAGRLAASCVDAIDAPALPQTPFKGDGKSVVRPSSLIGSSSGCEFWVAGEKVA